MELTRSFGWRCAELVELMRDGIDSKCGMCWSRSSKYDIKECSGMGTGVGDKVGLGTGVGIGVGDTLGSGTELDVGCAPGDREMEGGSGISE